MPATPQFVRWTLPLACALREETDATEPDQTQRQLRSLRAYSDCLHDGRALDGVCVSAEDPTLGFPAQEVLHAYGGAVYVPTLCDGCEMNVLRGRQHSGLAGCFGMLVFEAEHSRRFDNALQRAGVSAAVAELFLATNPRWYGLWTQPLLDEPRIAVMQQVFAALGERLSPEEHEFHSALNIAARQGVSLHVRLYPAGETMPDGWRIQAHCGRCKVSMPERGGRCAVCGLVAHAEPGRRRKARGSRPFVPLARFLGVEGAQAFLARYLERSAERDGG